jgi:hypothetical protein
MKRGKLLLVAIMMILLVCGCKNKKEYTLIVNSSDWSGWTDTYDVDKVKEEIVVEKGKKYTLRKNAGWQVTIKITKVSSDSITFTTDEGLSGDGGLLDYATEFTIKKNETLHLNTVTMDAGCSYDITLKIK